MGCNASRSIVVSDKKGIEKAMQNLDYFKVTVEVPVLKQPNIMDS